MLFFPKTGVVTGNFLVSVWEGSCNEKSRRIHFLVGFCKHMLYWPDISVPSDPHRANALLRDESLEASIALQLQKVSKKAFVPLNCFCHTEGATRQCPKTVLLCFPTAAISSRGSNLRCWANCVFQPQRAPYPLAVGVLQTVFLLPHHPGEESLSSITAEPRSLFPFSSKAGFDPGFDLLSFWKRGRYQLSYGVMSGTIAVV